MARDVTIDCDICSTRLPLERAKEAFVATGQNAYNVFDVCPKCLDDLLHRAESVNDTDGQRQQAAVLIRLRPGEHQPQRSGHPAA